MTERGLPIVDGAPACPFVAYDDARDDRSDRPDPRHRCYAESPPAPRARAHQEAYCLSANFPVCPTFQDWARREAARVTSTAAGGSPAERLRDVPAQREAGARPPAFGPAPGASAAGPGRGGSAGLGSLASEPVVPPAQPAATAGETLLDRIIAGDRHDPAGPGAGADAQPEGRDPWDLPPRRSVQPDWSAPPPWAPPRPAANDSEPEAPAFLRSQGGAAPDRDDDAAPWVRPFPETEDDDAGAAAGAPVGPAEREARMARLRALGIGGAGDDATAEDGVDGPRPVPGITRSVDPVTGRAVGAGRLTGVGSGDVAGSAGAPGAAGAAGAAAGAAGAPASGRSSGGLARLLGWDRRPRVGASRPARKPERDPSWERPRRFEAYPTLKTRVGLPMPSRLILALGAVLVAAAILFFVPPLFLKQGGAGPGASGSAAPSTSGGAVRTPGASIAPTTRPAPTPLTYTVKQGDTLSSIAKKYKVTIEQILAANKAIKNPNKIAPGDVIVIPTPAPSVVLDGGASSSP